MPYPNLLMDEHLDCLCNDMGSCESSEVAERSEMHAEHQGYSYSPNPLESEVQVLKALEIHLRGKGECGLMMKYQKGETLVKMKIARFLLWW